MNLRLTLFKLAAASGLSQADTHRLQQLADHGAEPRALATVLPRTLGVLAAALGGFGLILWIAANWATFSRTGRFALLEAVVLVTGLAAWLRPALRAPFSLLAFLGIGALFAFFGQTYQTGADPWQLFFVWALLGLPLCFGARSDVVWAPWALVVMTAVSLWGLAHREHVWFGDGSHNLGIDLVCWALSFLLVGGLSRAAEPVTGAGLWSLRTAITLAVVPVSFSALNGVFSSHVQPTYAVGLLVLVAAAALLSQRRAFDVYALSIVALAIDVLLIGGFTSLMVRGSSHEYIGTMFVLTGVSVGILTVSMKGVMHLARKHAAHGESA